jgi:hypothetical protein
LKQGKRDEKESEDSHNHNHSTLPVGSVLSIAGGGGIGTARYASICQSVM